jgi:predicted MFS family arabinose efflux permease
MTIASDPLRSRKGIKIRLIAGALLLLVLSLGFTALLTLSSLEKLYVASLVSKYRVIGTDLQRNLEKSLRFGKSIRKFIGIDTLLAETREAIAGKGEPGTKPRDAGPPRIAVSVSLPEGEILYSTDPKREGTRLPGPVRTLFDRADSGEVAPERYEKHGETYYVSLPVRGGLRKERAALVVITFGEEQVTGRLRSVFALNARYILMILAAGGLLLTIALNRIMGAGAAAGRFPKRKVSAAMFLVIGLSQVVFAGLNTHSFRTYYLEINQEKAGVLTTLLKKDIEYFLSLGRPIDRLPGMDRMMKEIISVSPELAHIVIYDEAGRPLYIAAREGWTDGAADGRAPAPPGDRDPAYNLRLRIESGERTEGYLEGYITTRLSEAAIRDRIRGILLDAATVLVISFLFFVELYILMLQFVDRPAGAAGDRLHYGAIRPAAFFFFFGIDICITFLPLYMGQLYEPLWGMSREVLMGIPLSVKMLFTGIGIFGAGIWLDRKGWHFPFFTGLVLSGSGYIYAWQAMDARHFIASQAVAGLGYGLTLMACQGFVAGHTDARNKAQGLAQLWAGVFAGAICGGAAGAMLAERIGYRPVFLIGAVIVFFVGGYAILFMGRGMKKPDPAPAALPSEGSAGFLQVVRFIFRRNIFALILFSTIPASAALVGFFNYFCPIYLKGIGVSQSSIGRVFMGFDLSIIYLAPIISRYMDRSRNKKPFIVAGDLVGGLAFAVFYLLTFLALGGLVATVAAVLLLGLSSCLSDDARAAYVLNLEATRELGEGKALGILSSAERVGQMLGPLIFSWLIAALSIRKAMPLFSLSLLGIGLFFLLISSVGGRRRVRAIRHPVGGGSV